MTSAEDDVTTASAPHTSPAPFPNLLRLSASALAFGLAGCEALAVPGPIAVRSGGEM
jgi:hypothetical protein